MLNFIDKSQSDNFAKLGSYIKRGYSFTASGINSFYKMLLLLQILQNKKVLFITSTEQNALRYKNDIEKISKISPVIFPYQDISMYDEVAPNLYKYFEQINIIENLKDEKLIFVPVKSLLEKFPSQKFINENSFDIKVNDDINISKLQKKLSDLGYRRATMVTDIGEYSIRGDIIDIFTFYETPVRIELWGDTVVDMRFFHNETQRSFQKISSIKIYPLYKFIIDEKTKNTFKTTYKDYPEILEKLENEHYFEGINYFQSALSEDLHELVEFLPDDYVVVFDESSEIFSKYELLDEDYKKLCSENIKNALTMPLAKFNHIEAKDFVQLLADKVKIFFDNFIDSESDLIIDFESSLPANFSSKVDEIAIYITDSLQKGYKIIIATDYKKRLEEILDEFEIPHSDKMENIHEVSIIDNLSLGGAVIEDLKLILLTDRELFNKKSKDITKQKRQYHKEKQDYIESINDIQENEYVVHSAHGIGLYKGLSKQEIDGQLKDYLTIEYACGDKLHMPAEQINLLYRYRGSGVSKPSLSRMGGKDWTSTKSKVKKAVEDIARDLLILYAGRELAEGHAFEPDSIWQYEMEEAFEYTETPDQMRAITEVKSDMETEKPMDRLVCGDVGFGKTEVAIRAIFKAIMSGKQVAIIVPTTILALQHYQTLVERFKPFPIKVDLLSRFRTPQQQKQTVKDLKLGECDVVVATHRLLQSDIAFKKLGLLVIDEEHKFGVKDKEKLKMLKKNIDIISMSATPIPRTLYMSLSGIKDMSIINTPPMNRLPIKTFVGHYSDIQVKNAINYEIQREGQVYFLYNRVESIYEFSAGIRQLVPNARIAVAHGQMDKSQLEKTIMDFANYEYDILICTTIIESGLDIPNANTIIIHNADKFGLAQLYQLRGRVGRSERQAYCYCFYSAQKELTTDARERLKAIKDFTTLGSGYQIALRDIEIRGVGNILGTKQHGHMVNVGFDTYCQLLEETVQELKGEKPVTIQPAIIDINITAFIPDDWVGSKEQKMIEYKRLADVKSVDELELITLEWKDRFSKMPEPVENLIKLVRLRLLATDARITLVREAMDTLRIYTPYNQREWSIIRAKLPANITKHIKFTIAPKSCTDGVSVLLVDLSYINFEELFNILTDLFYYINKNTNDFINQFYEEN